MNPETAFVFDESDDVRLLLETCRALEVRFGSGRPHGWYKDGTFSVAARRGAIPRDIVPALEYLFLIREVGFALGFVSVAQMQRLVDRLPVRLRLQLPMDAWLARSPSERLRQLLDVINVELGV